MKKRILCLFLTLLIIVGIMPISIIAAAAEEIGDMVQKSMSKAPVVSIEATEKYGVKNIAKPNASGNIFLTIKATGEITEDITVYYTTEDMSAIAGIDHEAKSGSVVLTKDKPQAEIGIWTTRSEYSMNVHVSGGQLNYKYLSRNFWVKLTGVEGNARIADSGKGDKIECAVLAEHNLEAYLFDKTLVLTPYTWYGQYEIKDALVTDKCGKNEMVTHTVGLNYPASWLPDYMETSLDAKLFLALPNAHIDESSWNSSTGVTTGLGHVALDVRGEFHDNEEFGWGAAFLYAAYGVGGPNGKYKDYYEENFDGISWWSFDSVTVRINPGETDLVKFYISEKRIIVRKYKYTGEPTSTPNDPNMFYIGLLDDYIHDKTFETYLASWGGYSRRISSGDITFRLEDITAPRIATKQNGSYAIYNNFDTAKIGDKLRVTIRFNEPVQVDGEIPYFVGKVNGSGNGSDSNPYTIRFDYAGGSGTDTLYFETDYSGAYQINSITDIKFVNAEGIRDLAGEPNSFVSPSDIIIDGFNLDRRNPLITVSKSDSQMQAWARTKKVTMTVSNISEEATLYYSWTDNTDIPTAYENKIELNDISVNGTKTVSIVGDGNGIKYLHLKVVSKYGQETTNIQIPEDTLNPLRRNGLGPYKFDNAPPTLDETKLVPNASSSMTQKKFSVSLPNDNGSGFSELKMYYIGTDGQNYLLKTYNLNSFKSSTGETRDVEISLTADEVGIEENTRRYVTVFFTLTDALGNTDEEVARQSIIFDTNQYIELISVLPVPEMVDKTEIIDDGYTLIYKGNPYPTGAALYTMEMRVYTDLIDGTPTFNVYQNGTKLVEGQYGYATYTYEKDENGRQITLGVITIHHTIAPSGYFDFQLSVGEGAAKRVSETYRLYVGTDPGKLENNINDGQVLINEVYQLPQSSYFYYMDASGTIGAINKELYNGTTLSASFSSVEKAYEYVLFNEYRDLYAVTLTAELAESLNAGNSNVQKAFGEETIAREGQVWIRYKTQSWDPTKAPLTSDWVFYYYGTTDILGTNNFSSLLTEALDSVSERIVSRGQTVALTSLQNGSVASGSSLLDKFGAPYLAPAQKHVQDVRLSDVACNSSFSTEITYTADLDIHSSGIMVNGVEYTLIGNVIIPTGTRVQYKRIDENGIESEGWTDIVAATGQRFRDVLTETGRYKIRELGTTGVNEYNVYMDKDAPMVSVMWKDKDQSSKTQTITISSEKEFRAKAFKIVGIDQREYDRYSYVALYNIATSKLYAVYTVQDLQAGAKDVPDGNYYMVVSDRSGNSYTMTLHINSTDLTCDIKESENVKIKFTCNRKDSQIQEFYVKRNGTLVSGKYASELEFTESGTYEFYVKDIYGNVYGPIYHEFKRVYPEVSWKYRDESGYFVSYDSNNKNKYFTLENTSDGVYTMSTSTSLKFQIASNYGFVFLGTAPKYEQNINDGTVTIKTTQSFKLKVYYEKHPDVYTIYTCSADTTAPLIETTIQINNSVPNELNELRQLVESGMVAPGEILIPSEISYSSTEKKTRRVENNEIVLSDIIKINVSDESGLSYVYVYLNDELIKEESVKNSSYEIVLSKAGKYLIVAEDVLGNKSEFTFTNGTPDCLTYMVDGWPLMLGLRDFEKFDENGNFTDVVYGNEVVRYILAKKTNAFFMISDAYGTKHFVAFDVSENGLCQAYYKVDEENNVVLQLSEELILDAKNPNLTLNKEYVVYEIEELGIKIYGNLNANGYVTLTIYALEDGEFTVDARLNTEDGEFHYTKTELSGFTPSLTLSTSEGILHIGQTNELIKINRPFKISTNDFGSEKVSFIEVYHSLNNDFGDFGYLFMKNIYEEDRYYEDEGFYFVRLGNEYGNVSEYTLHISRDFSVSSYAELADGEKIYYSASYSKEICSNNKVVFETYSSGVIIVVTKDGEEYTPVISIENGITYVILSEPGKYTVTMRDLYKNSVERTAEIDTSVVSFNEELLTGYNENALKKEDGYTNQKLSVSKEILESELISYLAVEFDGELTVLYDVISENGVSLDESKLYECIGNAGDGEYTFIARNKYGASWTKVIHYRETPTLTLERETRSNNSAEPYDLNKAILIGFWSNSELIFKSNTEYYEFKINGDKTECPKTLSFTSAGQYGHSEYEISYIDEYGFSYSFKAYLVRQDVEVTPDLENDAIDIEGVLTTTGNVGVKFTENATCTYTWNNSEERVYTPGEKLNRDGVYRFVVSDYAGNMSAITIKKDTTVEFSFINVNSSTPIQNGAVVNTSKVGFEVDNGDSAYIEKVYKNGVLQSDFSGTKFSEDGKWEIIVSDKLGNKSYFSFYIITKQKASFEYTSPYEYIITELWYDSGDGTKISYIKFVDQYDSSSSFKFDENGKYTVVMTSSVTGDVSRFEFTINKTAPDVSLVGCNEGATTINDVTLSGCKIGDKIKVYRTTSYKGVELVEEIEVTSSATKMPTINEGGEYRIVVESEAGVETELNFVRKHVMNTEGSIFIMIIIAAAVVALFVGLIYRNKSKTDK